MLATPNYNDPYNLSPDSGIQSPYATNPMIVTGAGAAPKGSTLPTPGTWQTPAGQPAPTYAPPPAATDATQGTQTGGGFTMPTINPSDPASLKAAIAQGIKAAYGRDATDADYQYWTAQWPGLTQRGQELGNPQYAWQRLLGMNAGGSDVAASGPYAGGAGGSPDTFGATPVQGSTGATSIFQPAGFNPAATSIFDPSNPGAAEGSAYYQQLLGISNGTTPEGSNPNLQINADTDPIIRPLVNAYSNQSQLAQRAQLAQLAERVGSNANISAETRQAAEAGGQATSQYQATLAQQELAARRAEIQLALSGEAGYISQKQQIQLQEKLNQMNLAEKSYEFDTTQQYLNSPLAS